MNINKRVDGIEKTMHIVHEVIKKYHESNTSKSSDSELGKVVYESLSRKVPWEVYREIWKKYNSEGGYTVKELARHYRLSQATITAIVKDQYW